MKTSKKFVLTKMANLKYVCFHFFFFFFKAKFLGFHKLRKSVKMNDFKKFCVILTEVNNCSKVFKKSGKIGILSSLIYPSSYCFCDSTISKNLCRTQFTLSIRIHKTNFYQKLSAKICSLKLML